MSWLQLRVQADCDNSSAIEDALLAAGAVSVTFEDSADQPILEPAIGETPLWDNTRVTGLFPADTDTDLATVTATAALGASLPAYRWEILEDRDWEREWMDNFHPIPCGERLWICPSWREPPQPEAVNLLLDPGLAFGTGTHPTTFLCLQWLDRADLSGKTVLDYGCGSGILGIAALLLGAREVVAVDNDPQALIATRENATRNGLAETQITTLLPNQLAATTIADITVANILAEPLISLVETLRDHTRPGGQIALSGILESQAPTLQARYQPWFALDSLAQLDGWACLSGRRKTP